MKTDNELIAEFHGWTSFKIGKGTGQTYWNFPEWKRTHFPSSSLKYDQDWDWVMPVWVKFRDLNLDDDQYNRWLSALGWYLYSSNTPDRFCKRLAYAIKWYNSTLK